MEFWVKANNGTGDELEVVAVGDVLAVLATAELRQIREGGSGGGVMSLWGWRGGVINGYSVSKGSPPRYPRKIAPMIHGSSWARSGGGGTLPSC